MKKYSKFFAILLALAMILPGIGQTALAANEPQVIRLGGVDRVGTAVLASEKAYNSASSVVLTGFGGDVDALTGTLLAGAKDAPLLITRKANLSPATKTEIARLGASTVFILGGENVVSAAVETELKEDYTVKRIKGDNREETAVEVAKEVKGTSATSVFLALGRPAVEGDALADALAIGPVSAMKEMPVLLTKKNQVPAVTLQAMEDLGVTNVTIVGGTSAVSAGIETQLTNDYTVDRVEGSGREKTALAIADKYFPNPKNLIVAYGRKSADALVGGYLGAKWTAPILLTNNSGLTSETETYIKDNPHDTYVLGGETVVTEATFDAIEAALASSNVAFTIKSVKAISGTQVEVKFSQEIDSASAAAATYSITAIDGQSSPATTLTYVETKADNKTMILVTDQVLIQRYKLQISAINSKADASVKTDAYNEIINFVADTTAPTVLSTERISSNKVKIKFSEPVTGGTVTAKYADGTAISTALTLILTSGSSELDVDLSNAGVIVNKDIVVSFNGTTDMAGNLISPQPTNVTVVKEPLDGIEPDLTSVIQTGAKTFKLKFSKDLVGLVFTSNGAEVAVSGPTAVTGINKLSPSEYEVTVNTNLSGLLTVTVPGNKAVDLSGQKNSAALSKLVSFTLDTEAPKVLSSTVVKDVNDGKEYLELTFDKDLSLSGATVDGIGSYSKNFVTTPIVAGDLAATTVAFKNASNKKLIRVELDTFLGSTFDVDGAVYTLDLTFANVNSTSGIGATNKEVIFTRGSDDNLTLVAVTSIAQGADNNKVDVTFDKAVEGATAVDTSNYTVAGAIVESVSLKPVSGGTQVAVLNLEADSNTFTGNRNITVENVKALGSSVKIQTYTAIVSLVENLRPKVTEAKLTANNKITVKFSEPVILGGGTGDFELLIGGLVVTGKTTVTSPTHASPGVTTAVFTVAVVDAADVSSGLSLRGLAGINIKDDAINGGNKIYLPSAITVIQ